MRKLFEIDNDNDCFNPLVERDNACEFPITPLGRRVRHLVPKVRKSSISSFYNDEHDEIEEQITSKALEEVDCLFPLPPPCKVPVAKISSTRPCGVVEHVQLFSSSNIHLSMPPSSVFPSQVPVVDIVQRNAFSGGIVRIRQQQQQQQFIAPSTSTMNLKIVSDETPRILTLQKQNHLIEVHTQAQPDNVASPVISRLHFDKTDPLRGFSELAQPIDSPIVMQRRKIQSIGIRNESIQTNLHLVKPSVPSAISPVSSRMQQVSPPHTPHTSASKTADVLGHMNEIVDVTVNDYLPNGQTLLIRQRDEFKRQKRLLLEKNNTTSNMEQKNEFLHHASPLKALSQMMNDHHSEKDVRSVQEDANDEDKQNAHIRDGINYSMNRQPYEQMATSHHTNFHLNNKDEVEYQQIKNSSRTLNSSDYAANDIRKQNDVFRNGSQFINDTDDNPFTNAPLISETVHLDGDRPDIPNNNNIIFDGNNYNPHGNDNQSNSSLLVRPPISRRLVRPPVANVRPREHTPPPSESSSAVSSVRRQKAAFSSDLLAQEQNISSNRFVFSGSGSRMKAVRSEDLSSIPHKNGEERKIQSTMLKQTALDFLSKRNLGNKKSEYNDKPEIGAATFSSETLGGTRLRRLGITDPIRELDEAIAGLL